MGTDRDRIEAHLPLRPVEFHILLSLAAGERHGYGIIQDIQARGEHGVPDVGTMYRALARMVDQGLIEAVSQAASDSSDERRNNYRITSRGVRVAKAEARRLQALARAARIGGLLEKGNAVHPSVCVARRSCGSSCSCDSIRHRFATRWAMPWSRRTVSAPIERWPMAV